MKALGYYLKSRAALLLGALLGWLFLGLVPALEGNDAGFGYAHALSGGVFLATLLLDFWGVCRRHGKLAEKRQETPANAEALPPPLSLVEADYQAICRALDAEKREIEGRSKADAREAQVYYARWVHQVKTPIAAARLLLQTDAPDRAALSAELFKIEQYADMALCYTRLGEGVSDYDIARCPLDPIVRGAIRKYARLFILKKLTLRYAGTDKIVLTDEKWLAFALEQILSNALKYTKTGGITISVSGDTLSIEDTGVGIRAQDLPRVFDRGFTGYNGRIDKKATGIGLYLTRRALSALGHGLSIQSTQNVGTRVLIDLSAPDMRHE